MGVNLEYRPYLRLQRSRRRRRSPGPPGILLDANTNKQRHLLANELQIRINRDPNNSKLYSIVFVMILEKY